MKREYYYLHTNGALIKKNAFVVESAGVNSYFNSPFVIKHWVATTPEDVEIIRKEAADIRLMKGLPCDKQ